MTLEECQRRLEVLRGKALSRWEKHIMGVAYRAGYSAAKEELSKQTEQLLEQTEDAFKGTVEQLHLDDRWGIAAQEAAKQGYLGVKETQQALEQIESDHGGLQQDAPSTQTKD